MRKLLAIVLCAALCLSFAGCGETDRGDRVAALCETGRHLLEEGNYSEASDTFTQAVELDSKCAEAYIGRGDACTALDMPRAAAENYEAALSCSVGDAELFHKLLNAYIVSGKAEEATALVERAYSVTGDESFLSVVVCPYDNVETMQLIDHEDALEFLYRYRDLIYEKAFLFNPAKDDVSVFLEEVFEDGETESLGLSSDTELDSAEFYELKGLIERYDSNLYSAGWDTLEFGQGSYPGLALCITNDRLQRCVDNFFGKNRVDVRNGGNDGSLLYQLSTDKAVVIRAQSETDGFYMERAEIDSSSTTNGYIVFFMYMIRISGESFDENGMCYDACIVDLAKSSNSDSEETIGPVTVSATIGRNDSFDEILSRNGIAENTFSSVSYIFYMTEDGVRFWGTWTRDLYARPDNPGAEWTNPARNPQVVPESLGEETRVFISRKGNPCMREGPSVDYSEIQTIPNGPVVRTYAEQDGWYYAKYLGRCGWISGEYCTLVPRADDAG